ncbi:hypothetical protein [Paenibacillus sp. IHBB 3054]|uniref:hypothetical protein n=1 Tax=Paenibacillus sp. IHBB 3054 TaxID=3425689 RepID=UPI003F66F827
MIKKFITIFMLALVLLTPVSAFADSPQSDNIAIEGIYSGDSTTINTATSESNITTDNSTNLITPQEIYLGRLSLAAKKVGSSTLEVNFTFSANDDIQSAYIVAELQYYSPEIMDWVSLDDTRQYFTFNPATETAKGQFNFYDLSDGQFRVEVTDCFFTGRNTVFNDITNATSNSVFFGVWEG